MYHAAYLASAFASVMAQMEIQRKRDLQFEALLEPLPLEKQAELRALRLIAQENRAETKVDIHNKFSIL